MINNNNKKTTHEIHTKASDNTAHQNPTPQHTHTHRHARSALNGQFWWVLCGPVNSGALLCCLFSCLTQWKELWVQKSIHEPDFALVTATHTLLAPNQKPREKVQFCFWYCPQQRTKECANVFNSSCASCKDYAWMQTLIHRNLKFKHSFCCRILRKW